MRIVSLVPSLTHLLFDLGLENEIVGRTKFCIYPKKLVKSIPIIDGTKNVKLKKVFDLKPQILIASKEENVKAQVEELAENVEVLLTDIKTLKDNLAIIELIGEKTNRVKEAERLQNSIQKEFKKLKGFKENPYALYLIWKNPYMSVGQDTFIHDLLNKAGFRNIFEDQNRYPQVDLNKLPIQPELVFLSSEPYPFAQKHMSAIQKDLPNAKIVLVDGEAFSWYGSFIQKSPQYFLDLRADLNLN